MKIRMANEGILVKIEQPTIYIHLVDFPKKKGNVVYNTVQARDDNMVLVNLDYDKKGKLIGIEIMEWEK